MKGHSLDLAVVVLLVLGIAVAVRLVVADADPADDAPGEVPPQAELARVVSHVDGDTIRLVGVRRSTLLDRNGSTPVRLLEIDAPEVDGPYGDAECFGGEAGEALAELLPVAAEVWVTRDEDLIDPYDRTLLYLWTDDGKLVNLEMVRQGYARSVLFEPNDEHIEEIRRAQSEARSARRGIWGACR